MATRRSRSLLIDTTIGKIFTNTPSIQAADASKLIAGTKIASASISTSRGTTAKITKNLSGNAFGIRFPSGGLITSVTITASVAPVGRSIIIVVKAGTTYDNSVQIFTDELASTFTRRVVPVALTIPIGSNVYVDITQVGIAKPGAGVGIQFSYYAG